MSTEATVASATSQTVTISPAQQEHRAFLAQPPRPKRRPIPTQPLPPLPPVTSPASASAPALAALFIPASKHQQHRSAIDVWATCIQPGSPAPCSPRSAFRRPSVSACSSRRPSFTHGARRPSLSSARGQSASFLSLTPTTASTRPSPSTHDCGFVIVPWSAPTAPASATLPHSAPYSPVEPAPCAPPAPAAAARRPKPFARFRSLSVTVLHPRSRAYAPVLPSPPPAVPALPATPAMPAMPLPRASDQNNAKPKQKKAKRPMPMPLAAEAELMQLLGGGTMNANVQRVMEERARGAAVELGSRRRDALTIAPRTPGRVEGVEVAYRDEQGGVWVDQDERWEHTHLLAHADEGGAQWIQFGAPRTPGRAPLTPPSRAAPSALAGLGPGEERRESVSTLDSDLDPALAVEVDTTGRYDELAPFLAGREREHARRALRPCTPTSPSRRRAAPSSPSSPRAPRSPRSPRSLHSPGSPGARATRAPVYTPGAPRARSRSAAQRRSRRRPVPLALGGGGSGAPPVPDARQAFLDASFALAPVPGSPSVRSPLSPLSPSPSPSPSPGHGPTSPTRRVRAKKPRTLVGLLRVAVGKGRRG